MQHTYEVRFAKSDPETPPTMDEQIALAQAAARKLGVPNAEKCTAVSGGQELAHRRGVGLRGVDLGGASIATACHTSPPTNHLLTTARSMQLRGRGLDPRSRG